MTLLSNTNEIIGTTVKWLQWWLVGWETTGCKNLCGTVQFSHSGCRVKNDNRQSNRKQIAPKIQTVFSGDVNRKEESHFFSLVAGSVTVLLCILHSHSCIALPLNPESWGKSAPAVSTLIWLWKASIKSGHVAPTLILVTCYFSSHQALCQGINYDCHTDPRKSGRIWPAHLICVPSSEWTQHESANLFKTTCSGFLWIFSLLAVNTCTAAVTLFFFMLQDAKTLRSGWDPRLRISGAGLQDGLISV